jgi:hypothetical protein
MKTKKNNVYHEENEYVLFFATWGLSIGIESLLIRIVCCSLDFVGIRGRISSKSL